MTLELWIQEKRKSGNQEAVKRGKELLREFGEVPLLQSLLTAATEPQAFISERIKVYPEISLEEEFARQTGIIIERVAVQFGLSEQDALAIMPKRFPQRPESFNDENSAPVIVPKFLFPWGETVDAAKLGMSAHLRDRLPELSEWKDPRGIVTPNKPYGAWFYVGDDYLYRKPQDVRSKMRKDERGGDQWDGLGLSVVREDIIKAKPFDLVGSGVGLGGLVSVGWWDDRPEFSAGSVELAAPGFRGLVCGSEVST